VMLFLYCLGIIPTQPKFAEDHAARCRQTKVLTAAAAHPIILSQVRR
jgi:hypothetical protein